MTLYISTIQFTTKRTNLLDLKAEGLVLFVKNASICLLILLQFAEEDGLGCDIDCGSIGPFIGLAVDRDGLAVEGSGKCRLIGPEEL